MTCPVCGAGSLVRATRALPYMYKGERTVIARVQGAFCEACGGGLGPAALTKVSAAMVAFQRAVNGRLADPAFLLRVRKKLGLGQREAAAVFGCGVNAFSRYETGKTKPPVALVKLFVVLDRHPELLNEVLDGGRGRWRSGLDLPAPAGFGSGARGTRCWGTFTRVHLDECLSLRIISFGTPVNVRAPG